MHRTDSRLWFLGLLVALHYCSPAARAQAVNSGNQTGLPVFGSSSSSGFDSVSLQNGGLHIDIPLVAVPGRKNTAQYHFVYNTPAWTATSSSGGANFGSVVPVVDTATGWNLNDNTIWNLVFVQDTDQCQTTSHNFYHEFALIDPAGTKHPFGIQWESSGGSVCYGTHPTGYALDGSGIFLDIRNWNATTPNFLTQTKVTLKDGSQVTLGPASIRDSNGNLFSFSSDTLARQLLTIANGPSTTYTSPLGQTIVAPAYTLYNTTDSGGVQRSFRLDYQFIDVQTNACPSLVPSGTMCTEDRTPRLVPKKLTLPDGLAYTFTYANAGYADLLQINLPSGGSIGYTYGHAFCCGKSTFNKTTSTLTNVQSLNPVVSSRVVTGTNGTSATWSYTISAGQGSNNVVDPLGTKEVHSFAFLTNGSIFSSVPYETDVQTLDSNGNLLRTLHKDYAFETGSSDSSNLSVPEVLNARVIRETTTLENNTVTKKETDYEEITVGGVQSTATFLNPTEIREYSYGTSAPGPLIRRTDYTYRHQSNSTYLNLNLLDLPTSIIVYDGGSNILSQTQYEYDNYTSSLQASGAVQHDSTFGTSYLTLICPLASRTGSYDTRNS